MRKVVLSMMVSLDGFIEGTNREINWHVWDEEMQEYMSDFFSAVDTLLYGRVSYELMLNYWPSAATNPSSTESDIQFAQKMNSLDKIVFSRTLDKVEWNAKLIKENIEEEITKMKQQTGKDLVLFAGADIASTFMNLDLIDEYRLIVNPVILGSGKALFKDNMLNLKHLQTRTFSCGNVLLCYEPQSKKM